MKLPDLAIIWKNVQVLDKLEEMFFPESRGTYGIVQHFLNNKKLERKKRKQKSKKQKKKKLHSSTASCFLNVIYKFP